MSQSLPSDEERSPKVRRKRAQQSSANQFHQQNKEGDSNDSGIRSVQDDSKRVVQGHNNWVIQGDNNQVIQNLVTNQFARPEAQEIAFENRLQLLGQLHRESQARCIERWQALGVSESEAIKFTEDSLIGAPPSQIQLCPGKLIFLVGELGLGKSLIAERLFQSAIKQAQENVDAPIPIYLEAREVTEGISKVIESAATGIGNPNTQGAIVIIDGADEVTGIVSRLLKEARLLVKAWLNTTVVIASRPMPIFRHEENQEYIVPAPLLSDQEAYSLVEQFAQIPFSAFTASELPESIGEAIHRPLFAILLGIYLSKQGLGVPNSIGKLLSNLVERSLGRETADSVSANQLLQKLAVRCIEYEGFPVPANEIASRSELKQILDSRLVVEHNGQLSFPLQILTEWFAVQSLEAGYPQPESLLSSIQKLELWKYPLIIAISTFGHENTSKLLTPIAQKYPAFAGEIVSAALISGCPNLPPPLWLQCGQRIREAMQGWVSGMSQPLAKLIAPVKDNSEIRTIGIKVEEYKFQAAWYRGDDHLDDVVELPLSRERNNRCWVPRKIIKSIRQSPLSQQGSPSAWAWKWTLNELVDSLSKLLKNRALPIEEINNGLLAHEALWQLARLVLKISRRSSFSYYPRARPIPLNLLEECLSDFPNDYEFFDRPPYRLHRNEINTLATKVNQLREVGEIVLNPPWPQADRDGDLIEGWPWQCYTPETIRIHAENVYREALNAYQQIVKTLFAKFAERLEMNMILPACLWGFIDPDDPAKFCWYFEVLPSDKHTKVQFQYREKTDKSVLCINTELNEKLYSFRPSEVARWIDYIPISYPFLKIFLNNSATELVYTWLWEDLKRVSWVKGHLGDPPKNLEGWL